MQGYLDVHQHLWPAAFVAQLRRRTQPPYLRDWTLHTDGEAPYPISPDDHDPLARRDLDPHADRVLVSISSPLGIEYLPPEQAEPLLDAWHQGVQELGAPFAGWAAVSHVEPDLDGLKVLLADGEDRLVGLQVPATALATPTELERLAPVLRVCEALDRPVLVHPGPVAPTANVPPWWPAVVDYPAQLQAAWWSWHQAGRALLPELRICFAAGAGLAPVHHERYAARATPGRLVVDRNTFVETSSYGRQGVDALIRALGIDVIVLGSDRPYAEPLHDPHLGDAAQRAIRIDNPTRLLKGERP